MIKHFLQVFCVVSCLLVAACGSQSASPTPDPSPTIEVTSAPTETAVSASEVGADTAVERGRALFLVNQTQVGFACATCHYTSSERRLIGPGFLNFSTRVAEYNPEDDLETYIRSSILAPDSFLSPDDPPYPAGLMPSQYAALLTEQEIDDLIAYILTL